MVAILSTTNKGGGRGNGTPVLFHGQKIGIGKMSYRYLTVNVFNNVSVSVTVVARWNHEVDKLLSILV